MTNSEKLNELFSDAEYIASIKDMDNMPAIYASVSVKIPGVTEEELSDYLHTVSKAMAMGEISESDLDNVSGGFGWGALAGGIAAIYGVIKLVNGCYTAGENLGKFIGNLCR